MNLGIFRSGLGWHDSWETKPEISYLAYLIISHLLSLILNTPKFRLKNFGKCSLLIVPQVEDEINSDTVASVFFKPGTWQTAQIL